MKKNSLILKLIIMAVAVSLLVCSLEAFDSHIDFCDDDDCIHCAIISNAQNIMQIALAICIYVVVKLSLNSLIQKMYNLKKRIIHLSLVNQAVQFNE